MAQSAHSGAGAGLAALAGGAGPRAARAGHGDAVAGHRGAGGLPGRLKFLKHQNVVVLLASWPIP